jgi:DNA-binding CsgD family transcriptional regulator
VNVCGISVLTRKSLVTRRFGSDAWGQFFRDVASTHHCFRSLITANTLVPLPAFLAFHDELMRRFFKDDERSYLDLGRESSRWAIGDGPLKKVLEGLDIDGVITALPKFHDLYFRDTSTRSEVALSGSSVEFKVRDLPHWHPYFEHFVVGYIAEILEMYCANPIRAVRLRGGAGTEYRYLLHGAPSDGTELRVNRNRELPATDIGKYLSKREIEVLVLVAHGHTNEEIGDVLGISKKTAQHHVARGCRKIGVSGRVGAAVWLAERGLVDG